MRKQDYFVMPNSIITDPMLYSSSKRVMAALLAYCSPKDIVRKSVEELAALSGCCVATVRKALAELEARGFIRKIRCYRTSRFISRPIYATSIYQIRRSKLSGGYTLVPRELLTAEITHSAFVTALYVYKTAGRRGRSWASLRNSSKGTDLSKATICRALKALRLAQLICRILFLLGGLFGHNDRCQRLAAVCQLNLLCPLCCRGLAAGTFWVFQALSSTLTVTTVMSSLLP